MVRENVKQAIINAHHHSGQVEATYDDIAGKVMEIVGLTFNDLRAMNIARMPRYKNKKGEPAHSQPDGSDWSLSDWMNAIVGELGEFANIIKKVTRWDMTLDEARPALAKEFADVQTYLDIAAFRAGIDLGQATRDKWNEVSDRVGCPDLKL